MEFLRILKDVKLSALFREIEKDLVKVSLRSKGDIDVSVIAVEFGGGGHKNAAGYRVKASLQEARDKLIEKLKKLWCIFILKNMKVQELFGLFKVQIEING